MAVARVQEALHPVAMASAPLQLPVQPDAEASFCLQRPTHRDAMASARLQRALHPDEYDVSKEICTIQCFVGMRMSLKLLFQIRHSSQP
ncbi:hypothetical protein F0P96_20375 [Hymenobacter busanensis]|uniref:Uncharacterized protein n=1 Tax=Hymenobacter busanensis TaxID=2607656 RepID=A0A7L4ZWP8_9BACT|nr:hypothetical protein [Hymenobacter busanensis]KAA9325359.1 hypothetical protein F0P96_20375 [Hymenobacter busanensis]QHJ07648.1 hypothetical protein GUY19_10260 [Hymenobacter busanensis]